MEWTPLSRSNVHVLGVDPTDPAHLDVRIQLDADPPPQWADFFAKPQRVRLDPALPTPQLSGREIKLRPMDHQLAACVNQIDARLDAANAAYRPRPPRATWSRHLLATQTRDAASRARP